MVLVVKILVLMNSGFAVMCARDGSMENVYKLLLQRLSILISTSALVVVTKKLEFIR